MLPGIVLVLLYVIAIFLITWRNPALGPPAERVSFRERVLALMQTIYRGILPFLWADLVLLALLMLFPDLALLLPRTMK